jgi:hypothetical protein
MEDASKILHLGARCSRYSRRVYRNEKQAGRVAWRVICGETAIGVGGIAEGEPAASIRTYGRNLYRLSLIEISEADTDEPVNQQNQRQQGEK